MTETVTRRGTYSEMQIIKDDRQLMNAIKKLEPNGAKELDKTMRRVLHIEVEATRKRLKALAGPLASVRTPATLGYGRSTNIHTKVADALKVHRNEEMNYTVHTGDTIQEATIGVEGQRGGRLSHIVAKGIDPFRYSTTLPMLVQSSTRWYAKTGARNWATTGMRMRAWHPGFYKTMDYIGDTEKNAMNSIKQESKAAIILAAHASGFYSAGGAAKLAGSGGNIKTNTGGTGIKAARG